MSLRRGGVAKLVGILVAALLVIGCTSSSPPAPPSSGDYGAGEPAAPQPTAPEYPSETIELMIPFAPGGGLDLFGRTVARILTEEGLVDQPINIIQRPGAGGSVGMAELVTERAGDDHILATLALHVHLTPLSLGTPHSYKDLTPIAKMFAEYTMMVVRAESPIQSLDDVAEMLRQDPAAVRFGGATRGNVDHMTAATFAKELGIDPQAITYVAYSGGESNAAVLGGHVDVGLGGLDLIDLVEAGRMRVLAVTSEQRLGGRFAGFPTFREQGYDVVFENWRGLFGPPGMPDYAVNFWRETLAQLVQTDAWREELMKHQWDDVFDNTEGFTASLDAEHEMYRTILDELGLLAE